MKWYGWLCLFLGMLCGNGLFSQEIAPEKVREAMDGGVAFLKSRQHRNGHWSEEEVHIGGVSVLCTLAMLQCGVPLDDPHMEKALEFLRKIDPTSGPVESTYVASLQTMVFCLADPKRDAGLIRRNVLWLQRTQKTKGPKTGSWGYPYGFGDPSNAQFALLALYEADRLGLEIDPKIWKSAGQFWKNTQNMDGSWAYNFLPPELGRQAPGSGSMTCAGIVSLIISAEKSQLADAVIRGERFLPCQRSENDLFRRISHGKRWMTGHFSVSRNPGDKEWLFYYLYGLERMGRMTEQRFIGDHDWFREGVAQILAMSHTEAVEDQILVSWKGKSSSEMLEPIATSLALLFLSKGRFPLLMSKVEMGEDANDWNWHRHDVRNLSRETEKRWDCFLTTQTVSLEKATVEDLLQAPVLYLSGKNSPLPSDSQKVAEQAAKLRDYLDRGGFLIAESVCPGGTFDKGFRQLFRVMFPEKGYSLRPLPMEHPIWRAETRIPVEGIRPIWALDYGCRTCLVFLPSEKNPEPSLSCLWELAEEARPMAEHSDSVKKRIRAGIDLGINLLAYATNRELKFKEENFQAPEESVEESLGLQRGKLTVANLRHGGGCEVAPHALRNLLRQACETLQLPNGFQDEMLNITSPRLFQYPVVFLQGRDAFRFTPREREQLRLYLERGGMIFANAICASPTFDKSLRQELALILPDNPLTPLPADELLLTPHYGGFDLTKLSVRGTEKEGKASVQLEGIRVEGRWGVIYSPLDISCALEQHQAMDCHGYTPEDAAKIGLNILLYTFQ